MAVNAPAAFHVKISDVFDGVTPLLADKDRDIREAVADVLSICLSANTQRGGQFYLRWHCRCFDMIINGLKNTSEVSQLGYTNKSSSSSMTSLMLYDCGG